MKLGSTTIKSETPWRDSWPLRFLVCFPSIALRKLSTLAYQRNRTAWGCQAKNPGNTPTAFTLQRQAPAVSIRNLPMQNATSSRTCVPLVESSIGRQPRNYLFLRVTARLHSSTLTWRLLWSVNDSWREQWLMRSCVPFPCRKSLWHTTWQSSSMPSRVSRFRPHLGSSTFGGSSWIGWFSSRSFDPSRDARVKGHSRLRPCDDRLSCFQKCQEQDIFWCHQALPRNAWLGLGTWCWSLPFLPFNHREAWIKGLCDVRWNCWQISSALEFYICGNILTKALAFGPRKAQRCWHAEASTERAHGPLTSCLAGPTELWGAMQGDTPLSNTPTPLAGIQSSFVVKPGRVERTQFNRQDTWRVQWSTVGTIECKECNECPSLHHMWRV